MPVEFLSLSGVTLQAVWSTVGIELVIFAVTVAFAAAIKLTSSPHLSKKRRFKVVEDFRVPCQHTYPLQKPQLGVNGFVADPSSATCGAARAPQRASKSQGTVVKNKQPSELVNNVMLLMRESPGQRSASQALQSYSELRANLSMLSDTGVDGISTSICDVMRRTRHTPIDLYTTLVHCAVRSGQCYLVENLLADMVKLGVTRSFAFYESTMKQLAGKKEYKLALKVYDQLDVDGLQPSVVTCSCLINFAAELGEVDRAVSFFEKLSGLTTPSIRAYMTVLRALSKHQDWARTLKIYRSMQERNVTVDSLVLNIVLATGVAADKLFEVTEILLEADTKNPPISDVVSYNTLIKGYAQRGEANQALHVVSLMQRRRLQPNAITFNTVMDATVRGGDCDQILDVLKRMQSCGLRPDKFTCSIFMKGIAKHPTPAKIQTALELLDEAAESSDATLLATQYNSILTAAASISDDALVTQTASKMKQRNITLTESLVKKFRERS